MFQTKIAYSCTVTWVVIMWWDYVGLYEGGSDKGESAGGGGCCSCGRVLAYSLVCSSCPPPTATTTSRNWSSSSLTRLPLQRRHIFIYGPIKTFHQPLRREHKLETFCYPRGVNRNGTKVNSLNAVKMWRPFVRESCGALMKRRCNFVYASRC